MPAAGPPPNRVDPLRPWPGSMHWRPVSMRLVLVELTHAFSAIAIVVLIAAGVWLSTGSTVALAVAVLAVLGGLVRAVLVVRTVRSWGYAERDEDLLVRHGLFVRRLSIVPYARMQFVDVTAGPLERALGLATVVLHTASAHSNARVPGLAGDEAARLRDRLTALGEVRAEGL